MIVCVCQTITPFHLEQLQNGSQSLTNDGAMSLDHAWLVIQLIGTRHVRVQVVTGLCLRMAQGVCRRAVSIHGVGKRNGWALLQSRCSKPVSQSLNKSVHTDRHTDRHTHTNTHTHIHTHTHTHTYKYTDTHTCTQISHACTHNAHINTSLCR